MTDGKDKKRVKRVIAKFIDGRWDVKLKEGDDGKTFSPREINQLLRVIKVGYRSYTRKMRVKVKMKEIDDRKPLAKKEVAHV